MLLGQKFHCENTLLDDFAITLQGNVTVDMVMNAWRVALGKQDAAGATSRMGTSLTVEEAAGLLHSCSPAALQHLLEPAESLAVPFDLFLKAALHTEGRENAGLEVLFLLFRSIPCSPLFLPPWANHVPRF